MLESIKATTSAAPKQRRRAVNQKPPADVTDFTGYPVYESGTLAPTVVEILDARPKLLKENSIDICLEWADEADQHKRECRHLPAWSGKTSLEFPTPETQGGVAFWRENVPRKFCLIYTIAATGREVTRECMTTVRQVVTVGGQP